MDELFVENFSKQYQHGNQTSKDNEKITVHPQENDVATSHNSPTLPAYGIIDMSICLDRLEKEIEGAYADFADYRFIFQKIRASFKQNSVEGVIRLLDDLEELLDLGVPLAHHKEKL